METEFSRYLAPETGIGQEEAGVSEQGGSSPLTEQQTAFHPHRLQVLWESALRVTEAEERRRRRRRSGISRKVNRYRCYRISAVFGLSQCCSVLVTNIDAFRKSAGRIIDTWGARLSDESAYRSRIRRDLRLTNSGRPIRLTDDAQSEGSQAGVAHSR